jgi:hypothetical protein
VTGTWQALVVLVFDATCRPPLVALQVRYRSAIMMMVPLLVRISPATCQLVSLVVSPRVAIADPVYAAAPVRAAQQGGDACASKGHRGQ